MRPRPIGQRRESILKLCGDVSVGGDSILRSERPLVAILGSRIGHDRVRIQCVATYTALAAASCKRWGGVLLINESTSVAALASRAAVLFAIPTARVSTSPDDSATLVIRPGPASGRVDEPGGRPVSIDRALAAVADHIDVPYLRRGGTIDASIRDRLSLPRASVRIATPTDPVALGHELMDAGAVGWHALDPRPEHGAASATGVESGVSAPPRVGKPPRAGKPAWHHESDPSWTDTHGQWLVHCTRGRSDPWPDESDHQYLDNLLLGDTSGDNGRPLTTLMRIIRGSRLVAAAKVTDRRYRVVCFTAHCLRGVLARRAYRPHLHRWDYEPYGVAIRRAALEKIAARPVVYGDGEQRDALEPSERFAFQSRGTTYDWTFEAEWRVHGHVDLNRFDRDDVKVFVKTAYDAAEIARFCPWPITITDDLTS